MSQPSPAIDMYALLRQAILEDDERDAKLRASLRRRAQREQLKAATFIGPIETPEQHNHAIGAIIGELDWTAELHLIGVELFTDAEENHLA